MPDLMLENECLFALFSLCDTQLRVGFGGAYALDWSVVIRVADDMGIEMDETFYGLLKIFEITMLAELRGGPSQTDGKPQERRKGHGS
jgi:hypothetical protein